MSVLQEILDHKREETATSKATRSLSAVRSAAADVQPALDFVDALRNAPERPALIAEIKRRSPSRGALAPDLDPQALARLYRANGAACISVLTDLRYFGGTVEDLIVVKRAVSGIPLLRKDFLCEEYQVYEARAAGADAVLLIAAGLATSMLRDLNALTLELGMSALIEVHSLEELVGVLGLAPHLIGINNRNLKTFDVDLCTTEELCAHMPNETCVVAESGIHQRADVDRLVRAPRPDSSMGIDAILVGEALVTATDIGAKTRELAGVGSCMSTGLHSRSS